MMHKITKKLALLVGSTLAIDLLIPGVGSGELALQTVLVAACGVVIYFRQ
jgi:hypothetical protein